MDGNEERLKRRKRVNRRVQDPGGARSSCNRAEQAKPKAIVFLTASPLHT